MLPKPFLIDLLLLQALAQTFELACNRTIEDLVADLDDQAAQDGGIDPEGNFLAPLEDSS